jgi:hypothetical protein
MYSNVLALTFLQSLAASNEVKTSRKYYALRAVTPPQLHYDPNRWDLRPGERELEQMGERKYGNLLQPKIILRHAPDSKRCLYKTGISDGMSVHASNA